MKERIPLFGGKLIHHPIYGIGKIIKYEEHFNDLNYLVYFFKAHQDLHDGAAIHGSCKDNHGWWFSKKELQCFFCDDNSLKALIEIRKAKI